MSILGDAAKSVSGAMKTIEDLEIFRHRVYILTRTWSGVRIGNGVKTDTTVEVSPVPYIKTYDLDIRLRVGGVIKAGDIIIKYMSKDDYPDLSFLETVTNIRNVQKFYKIDNKLYTAVGTSDGYAYWNIHLRKTNKKV